MTRPVELKTERTVIRLRRPEHADRFLRFRQQNRAHLAPWEPLRDENYYSLGHCERTIAQGVEAARQDRGHAFVAFDPDEKAILATFTFSNVVRGPFQACSLGYAIDAKWQGRGLMREVLEVGLNWAFDDLGLHRVMANYLPSNERSARLLDHLGFEREGYARRYLQIAGVWQDHVLMSKLRDAD